MNIDSWQCMAWNITKLHRSEFTEGCSIAAYYRNLLGKQTAFQRGCTAFKKGRMWLCNISPQASYIVLEQTYRMGERMTNSSHAT